MHILITNDDGIGAEGLNDLIDIVSKNHKITVVAPRISTIRKISFDYCWLIQ